MSSTSHKHGQAHAELLCLYVLQALSHEEMASVEAQISGCAECRRELEALRPIVESFVSWPTDVLRPAKSLWGRLAATPCRDAVPESQARWIALLRAVAERDVAAMTSGARELLAKPSPSLESRTSREYLIAVAMAGYLAQDKHAEARALWERYGPARADGAGLELRLLYALAHPPQ